MSANHWGNDWRHNHPTGGERPTTLPEHTPAPTTRRKSRKFLWFFLAVQVLFLVWVIAGASSSAGSTAEACSGTFGADREMCEDAGATGTALGVMLIVFFWAAVDIILGIGYAIYRFARR